MAYEGHDPLEQWTKYINWLEENYPKGGKEGDLLTVLEQVFKILAQSFLVAIVKLFLPSSVLRRFAICHDITRTHVCWRCIYVTWI